MRFYLVRAAGSVGWEETSAAVVRARNAAEAMLALDAQVHQHDSDHIPSADGWVADRVEVQGSTEVILESTRVIIDSQA